MDVEECARLLRARSVQVRALEAGDLSVFGGEVYARGFLRTYASIVGIDPREVLRLHGEDPAFRGPVLPPREPLRIRRDPPGWLLGLVAVLAVAGLLVAVLGTGGRRAPEAITPADLADQQAGSEADATVEEAPTPEERPAPEQAVPAGPPVDVVLTFEATSWLEVLVDEVPVQPGTLVTSGATLRFGGQREVVLRLGNAGGVRVELNQQDLGPPGRPGEVVRLVLGPDGVVDPEAPGAAAGG